MLLILKAEKHGQILEMFRPRLTIPALFVERKTSREASCVGKNATGQLGQTDNLASAAEWYEAISDAFRWPLVPMHLALYADGSVSCWEGENGEMGNRSQ